jgi:SNF2 family DNA or RNA helicase
MLPAKEVISEELDFDETERKFYDDLLARGQQVIEELQASKGGLRRNYMCLLTMLLRLRQSMFLKRSANNSHGSCGSAQRQGRGRERCVGGECQTC